MSIPATTAVKIQELFNRLLWRKYNILCKLELVKISKNPLGFNLHIVTNPTLVNKIYFRHDNSVSPELFDRIRCNSCN